MKIVAFLGSPRVQGNTETLLTEALRPAGEGGHEIVTFRLNDMRFLPCQNCGGCEGTGECILDDDMTLIYKAIREGDRFIIASPIFFFGLSAQLKAMIDRCQCFWCEKYLLKRPIPEGRYGRRGLLLMVGGMDKDIGFKCGEATAKAFFRTINVLQHETLSFPSIDAKGAIKGHPTALMDAYDAGKRLLIGIT
ncbi:MAG: flavodoxin family protein [Thermodesulfovibrionia bacterium]